MSDRHDARGNGSTSPSAGTPAGSRQIVRVASRPPRFGFGHRQAAPLATVGAPEGNQSSCNETRGQFGCLLRDVVQCLDGFVSLRDALTCVQESEILEQCRHATKWRITLLSIGLLREFSCVLQPHDVDRIDMRVVLVVALDRGFQQFRRRHFLVAHQPCLIESGHETCVASERGQGHVSLT